MTFGFVRRRKKYGVKVVRKRSAVPDDAVARAIDHVLDSLVGQAFELGQQSVEKQDTPAAKPATRRRIEMHRDPATGNLSAEIIEVAP